MDICMIFLFLTTQNYSYLITKIKKEAEHRSFCKLWWCFILFHYSLTTDIHIFFERLCLPFCLTLLPKGEYTFPYNKYVFGVMFGDLFEGSEQTV